MTPGSSSTTAYSKAFNPDELVIAASIYQNEHVCIAFQTENGEFRIDSFKIAKFEPFGAQPHLSSNPPLIKLGSSLFVSFYPTFLSFADPGEKTESIVIGHGPIDANGDLHGLSPNANTQNGVSTLCVYQFDTSLGIIQDGRSEFILSNSHGKVYLLLPLHVFRKVLTIFVRNKPWPNRFMRKHSYALSVRKRP